MTFEIRGHCPPAAGPMLPGDEVSVPVRPRLARLAREQVLGLCRAAQTHGTGQLDLTRQAGLVVRGVSAVAWPALHDELAALGLPACDPAHAVPNVLVAPGWSVGDDTHRLARELFARLDEGQALATGMGLAIDAGSAPRLADTPVDFRIERGTDRRLLLRADGQPTGLTLTVGREIDLLIALARWFEASDGAQSGHMAGHGAALPDWARGAAMPAPVRPRWKPGQHVTGAIHGLAFGQVSAADLAAAMSETGAPGLRLTPWRLVMFEGAVFRPLRGLLGDPAAPELRADARP